MSGCSKRRAARARTRGASEARGALRTVRAEGLDCVGRHVTRVDAVESLATNARDAVGIARQCAGGGRERWRRGEEWAGRVPAIVSGPSVSRCRRAAFQSPTCARAHRGERGE